MYRQAQLFVEHLRARNVPAFVAFVRALPKRHFMAAFVDAFDGEPEELWQEFVAALRS